MGFDYKRDFERMIQHYRETGTMKRVCGSILSAQTATVDAINAYDFVATVFAWAEGHPYEPEIDWTKVPVDTPVLVRRSDDDDWTMAYFALYLPSDRCENKFACFSFSAKRENSTNISRWKHCKLTEDNPAYHKDV